MQRLRTSNTSGYVGVVRSGKRWRVLVGCLRPFHKSFATALEAHEARIAFCTEHGIETDNGGYYLDALTSIGMIPLTRNLIALVDAVYAEEIGQYNWCATRQGYAERRTPDGCIQMHHEVARLAGIEYDELLDHKNRDRIDNRTCNLRPATYSQNAMNSRKRLTHGGAKLTSQFKGISFDKQRGLWKACVDVGYRKYHVGRFATEQEAYEARARVALELHGEFAQLK